MKKTLTAFVVLSVITLTACGEKTTTAPIAKELWYAGEKQISDEECTVSKYSHVDPEKDHDECYNYCSTGCGPTH